MSTHKPSNNQVDLSKTTIFSYQHAMSAHFQLVYEDRNKHKHSLFNFIFGNDNGKRVNRCDFYLVEVLRFYQELYRKAFCQGSIDKLDNGLYLSESDFTSYWDKIQVFDELSNSITNELESIFDGSTIVDDFLPSVLVECGTIIMALTTPNSNIDLLKFNSDWYIRECNYGKNKQNVITDDCDNKNWLISDSHSYYKFFEDCHKDD